MEEVSLFHSTHRRAAGSSRAALIGVVASGNLEVLVERVLPDLECQVQVRTPIEGFTSLWGAVVADFVERHSPGGLRFSINDGGARPDVVSLRLSQAVRLIERSEP